MINATGYNMTRGGAWRQSGSGSNGNRRSRADHAERLILRDLTGSISPGEPVLIVQNAFPCDDCDAYFATESQTQPIIIKVTADEGGYGAGTMGLRVGATASTPCVLYYFQGSRKAVGLWSRSDGDAPQGFPAHPSFDNLE